MVVSGTFLSFCNLCEELERTPKNTDKTQMLAEYFESELKDDLYLCCKLLLCKEDKRVYNLKAKQLIKLTSRHLGCSLDDMLTDMEKGDVALTCKRYFKKYAKVPAEAHLNLLQVDSFLQQLTTATREDDQLDILSSVLSLSTPLEVKYLVKLVIRDLKINIGAKYVLEALHPDAFTAYKVSQNLKQIVERCKQKTLSAKSAKKSGKLTKASSSFGIGLSVMTPVKPMLAKKVTDLTECVTKSPDGMYAEIKYDGERIQIHKDGDEFKCFSRNLKPILEWKVKEVRPFIKQAAPKAHSVILDGEILLLDTETKEPLPFGTLSVHKRKDFATATVCVFVFDILYLNGKTLLKEPLCERRELMKEYVQVIPDRVLLSELHPMSEKAPLEALMKNAIRKGLEGLVVKPSRSIYGPGARHWFKLKKEYLDMADTVDLVVLGAFYGTGTTARKEEHGLLSIFLMGCYDKKVGKWKTVCKVGNGFDEATVKRLQGELAPNLRKIKKQYDKVPDWLLVHRSVVPDMVVIDPTKSPVWELAGGGFITGSRSHTADGVSIRFPIIKRIRDDKDYESHTNLEELKHIANLNVPAAARMTPTGKAAAPKKAASASGKGKTPGKGKMAVANDLDDEPTMDMDVGKSTKRVTGKKRGRDEKSKEEPVKKKMKSADSDSTVEIPPSLEKSGEGEEEGEGGRAEAFVDVFAVLDGFDATGKETLQKMIEGMGGVVQGSWKSRGRIASTHLVCTDPTSAKFKHVHLLGGETVRKEWVIDSYRSGVRAKELQYEMKKGGDVDLDVSLAGVEVEMEDEEMLDVDDSEDTEEVEPEILAAIAVASAASQKAVEAEEDEEKGAATEVSSEPVTSLSDMTATGVFSGMRVMIDREVPNFAELYRLVWVQGGVADTRLYNMDASFTHHVTLSGKGNAKTGKRKAVDARWVLEKAGVVPGGV